MKSKMNEVIELIEKADEIDISSDDGYMWMRFSNKKEFTCDSPFDNEETIEIASKNNRIWFTEEMILSAKIFTNVLFITLEMGDY